MKGQLQKGTKTNLAAIYMSTHLEGKIYTSSGGGGCDMH